MTSVEKGLAALAEIIGTMDLKPVSSQPKIKRVAVDIDTIELLEWLDNQKQNHKIYWRDRDTDLEFAGVGTTVVYYVNGVDRYQKVFDHLNRYHLDSENIAFYGGFSFYPDDISVPLGSDWSKFYDGYFVLPRFEICRYSDRTELACNIMVDPSRPDEIANVLTQLNLGFSPIEINNQDHAKIITRQDYPDRDGWFALINTVTELLKTGELQKIVLARKSIIECDRPLSPWRLLRQLKQHSQNCYLFGFQLGDNTTFISHTPERLYHRQGINLKSEALAGTRPRGKTDQDDIALRNELIESEKEQREHRFVLDYILDNLIDLCENIRTSTKTSVLKLERVQHLYSKIDAELKKGVTDIELLTALHPTPAVGGLPRDRALEEMKILEPFNRGWYAAPSGRVSRDKTDFAVAIRSAMIKGSKMNLYAGAGIVEGSEAASEWHELDNKISNYINLFKKS